MHKDSSYSPFTYSWTVHRAVRPEPVEVPTLGKRKRRSTSPKLLGNGGSNFYAASINVLVESAAGTAMAHRASEPHATTILTGAVNYGISIAFSGRLADAWNRAQAHVEKGELVTEVEETSYNF